MPCSIAYFRLDTKKLFFIVTALRQWNRLVPCRILLLEVFKRNLHMYLISLGIAVLDLCMGIGPSYPEGPIQPYDSMFASIWCWLYCFLVWCWLKEWYVWILVAEWATRFRWTCLSYGPYCHSNTVWLLSFFIRFLMKLSQILINAKCISFVWLIVLVFKCLFHVKASKEILCWEGVKKKKW